MLYNDVKTLIVVYEDEVLVNQLKKLVETNDDESDSSIVGTRDGSVSIVSWSEKVWLDQKKAGNINNKVLFLGKIKGTEHLLPVVDMKFDEYGVKYGWAGNQAIIVVDTGILNDEVQYDEFFEKFCKLPIPEAFRDKATPKVKTGKVVMSVVCDLFLTLGVKTARLCKKSFTDKKIVEKQMFFYGIINLYNNHLEAFVQA